MEELSLNDNMVEGEGCEQSLSNFVLHSMSLKKLCLSNVGLSNTIGMCDIMFVKIANILG